MKTKHSIYLAGSFQNRLLLQFMKLYLEKMDFKINARWLEYGRLNLKTAALYDYTDIDECDFVIATYPCALGTASELGYALALKKPIIFYIEQSMAPDLDDSERHGIGLLPLGKFKYFTRDSNFLVGEMNVIITNMIDLEIVLMEFKNIF